MSRPKDFLRTADELVCQYLTPGNVRHFGLKLLNGDYRTVQQITGEPTKQCSLETAFIELTCKWMDNHDPAPSWRQFVDKCQGHEYQTFITSLYVSLGEKRIDLSSPIRSDIFLHHVIKNKNLPVNDNLSLGTFAIHVFDLDPTSVKRTTATGKLDVRAVGTAIVDKWQQTYPYGTASEVVDAMRCADMGEAHIQRFIKNVPGSSAENVECVCKTKPEETHTLVQELASEMKTLKSHLSSVTSLMCKSLPPEQLLPTLEKQSTKTATSMEYDLDTAEYLGKGGFGEVYGINDRKVIKVINVGRDPRLWKDTLHEIKLLLELKMFEKGSGYDNILHIDGHGEEKRDIYIEMQRATCSMAQFIGMPQYEHNKFFGREVKLCDFGLARIKSKDSTTSTARNVCGTLYYSAPEVHIQERPAQYYSDVWSMGVTNVEWLTGRRAWDLPADDANHRKILRKKKKVPTATLR